MQRLTNDKWWTETFRIFITTIAFFFVIGAVFFTFSGNWAYLKEFDFYSKTVSTTMLALFLRWLWHKKGFDLARNDEEIKGLEGSKTKRINQVSEKNLVQQLKINVEEFTENNKAKSYRDKCDSKLTKYIGKHSIFKFMNRYYSRKISYWTEEKDRINKWLSGNKDAINVKNIKHLSYYNVKPAQMMSVCDEYAPRHSRKRSNASNQLARSYGLNVMTLLSYGFAFGISLISKDFSLETIMLMIVQTLILTMNMFMGIWLGIKLVKSDYKEDLIEDTAFLQNFLNNTQQIQPNVV